jgi:hypothetical protein
MRTFLYSLLGFVGGLVLGYAGILFGWIAYADVTDYFDFEGASAMGVAFGVAPAGGVLCGLVAALWLGRASRRQGSTVS